MAVDMDHAVNQLKGMTVIIDGNSWYGNPDITEDVTPVKITIRNGHTSSLRIRYNDIFLSGESGRHYAALPPYKIEGTIDEPVITAPEMIYSKPLFDYKKFRIAPYFGQLYPDIPSIRGDFYIDPLYQDRYYAYWSDAALPTGEMLTSALLEGDIDPGGEVSGFIYFERLANETKGIFHMNLVDAKTDARIGTMTIPFNIIN
jgi:hypothetical protein